MRFAPALTTLALACLPSFAQLPESAPGADFWRDFDKESARIRDASSLFPCGAWTGESFKTVQDYPKAIPPAENWPWLAIQVEKDPKAYLASVLAYVIEGNDEVDWRVEKNKVRRWFHSPWMTFNKNGREPIRGLTKERDSEIGELDPKQDTKVRNWAVAIYNAQGGWVMGSVWRNPRRPSTGNVAFPVGTVSAKLLFTEADPAKVDLLNSPEALVWEAAVDGRGPVATGTDLFSQVGKPKKVRLLQLDLAVREERVPTATGWVFGTYYFDAAQPGTKWHQKLVPAGVMWGNDPDLTHAAYKAGARPKNSWVNPDTAAKFRGSRKCGEMGLRGRANGPVDNPLTSCLGCHGRACDLLPPERGVTELLENRDILGKTPAFHAPKDALGLVGDKGCEVDDAKAAAGEAVVKRWFRDLAPSEPFEAGYNSLDYSLQLSDGVANFYGWALEFKKNWKPAPPPAADAAPLLSPAKYCMSGFEGITNFGRGDECVEVPAESRPGK
jgi:hypothetical protein